MDKPHPWKPDPSDTRIPIGAPDTISMHHQHINLLAALRMPNKYRECARDMGIRRCFKSIVGKLYSVFEKSFVIHGLSIGVSRSWFHSYFPLGV